VEAAGIVLSSRFARCRDADSLVFDSVRLFDSLKTWIHHVFSVLTIIFFTEIIKSMVEAAGIEPASEDIAA